MGNGTLSATVKSDQQDALTLESIFISDKRKLAVINGQTVSINQTINGVFIKNITAKEVTVRHKGQDKKLHIIKPLLKTRNGARQG
jgi:hypothetical protein